MANTGVWPVISPRTPRGRRSYTADRIDELLDELERKAAKLKALPRCSVRRVALQNDLFTVAQSARDVLESAVSEDKTHLDEVFCGERIRRFKALLDGRSLPKFISKLKLGDAGLVGLTTIVDTIDRILNPESTPGMKLCCKEVDEIDRGPLQNPQVALIDSSCEDYDRGPLQSPRMTLIDATARENDPGAVLSPQMTVIDSSCEEHDCGPLQSPRMTLNDCRVEQGDRSALQNPRMKLKPCSDSKCCPLMLCSSCRHKSRHRTKLTIQSHLTLDLDRISSGTNSSNSGSTHFGSGKSFEEISVLEEDAEAQQCRSSNVLEEDEEAQECGRSSAPEAGKEAQQYRRIRGLEEHCRRSNEFEEDEVVKQHSSSSTLEEREAAQQCRIIFPDDPFLNFDQIRHEVAVNDQPRRDAQRVLEANQAKEFRCAEEATQRWRALQEKTRKRRKRRRGKNESSQKQRTLEEEQSHVQNVKTHCSRSVPLKGAENVLLDSEQQQEQHKQEGEHEILQKYHVAKEELKKRTDETLEDAQQIAKEACKTKEFLLKDMHKWSFALPGSPADDIIAEEAQRCNLLEEEAENTKIHLEPHKQRIKEDFEMQFLNDDAPKDDAQENTSIQNKANDEVVGEVEWEQEQKDIATERKMKLSKGFGKHDMLGGEEVQKSPAKGDDQKEDDQKEIFAETNAIGEAVRDVVSEEERDEQQKQKEPKREHELKQNLATEDAQKMKAKKEKKKIFNTECQKQEMVMRYELNCTGENEVQKARAGEEELLHQNKLAGEVLGHVVDEVMLAALSKPTTELTRPTEEAIRRRAYELWEQDRSRSAEQNWFMAEKQIRAYELYEQDRSRSADQNWFLAERLLADEWQKQKVKKEEGIQKPLL